MKGLVVVLTAIMVCSLAAQAAAQETKACPPPGTSRGGQFTQPESRLHPDRAGVVSGQVTSVASDLQLLSVQTPGGEPEAINVTPQTRITFPDGNLATLADIEPGQRVRASYRMSPEGRLIAQEVEIEQPGPAAGPGRGQGGQPSGWKE